MMKWTQKDIDRLSTKGLVVEGLPPASKQARTKYRNKKVEQGGRQFDSKKEARRYPDLVLLQTAGEIRDLKCQQEFKFVINGELVCSYIADFTYTKVSNSEFVVEDVKSESTRKNRAYRIKCKLMKAVYSITILET